MPPSPTSRVSPVAGLFPGSDTVTPGSGQHPHAVHFYDREDTLYEAVAAYLGEGLRQRQPLLVVASSARRDGFLESLERRGVDGSRILSSRQFTFADADDAIDGFMDGEMPDEARFRDSLGGLLERVRKGSRPIRAYGEMVDILWRRGNAAAALRVEELWNELAARHSFSLFCAYSMAHFADAADAAAFRQVCERHTHVLPVALGGTRSGQQIAELQQRAAALERELVRRRELESRLRDALRERRRAERSLRAAVDQAERANRAKSDFLAVVSHELRTPLNAIIGYDELLAMEVNGPITVAQRGHVDRIRGAAEQLLRLIDQILNMSRIEAGQEHLQLEVLDGGALLAETVALMEPLAARRGLTLVTTLPQQPVRLTTDAGKLRQVLLNLLANAIKFTVQGGIEASVRLAEGDAVFAVADTGVGVNVGDAERIFEPFVQADSGRTRAHGGTGLGLSVSREFARLMGGDVVLEHTSSRGSTFAVRLPLTGPVSTPAGIDTDADTA